MSPKQRRFVDEYLVDLNATQAAIRAGYNTKTARSIASENLTKPDVANAIAAASAERHARLSLEADDMVRLLSAIVLVDRNELTECRRVACRYCHSPNGDPQFTVGEQRARRRKHELDLRLMLARLPDSAGAKAIAAITAAMNFDELGGDGYDQRRSINPECVECAGDGDVRAIFKDTTQLSPAARAVFEGVKVTRGGMEYKMFSRAKALELLTRRWGLCSQDGEPDAGRTGTPLQSLPADPVQAARVYMRLMDG